MTKDELMNRLWSDSFVEERNLAQNIFTIRKALNEKEGGQKFIETVPRRGYRFIADVSAVKMNGSDAAAIDNIAGGDGDVFKPAAVTVQAPPVKKRWLPSDLELWCLPELIVVGLYTQGGPPDRAAVPAMHIPTDRSSNGSIQASHGFRRYRPMADGSRMYITTTTATAFAFRIWQRGPYRTLCRRQRPRSASRNSRLTEIRYFILHARAAWRRPYIASRFTAATRRQSQKTREVRFQFRRTAITWLSSGSIRKQTDSNLSLRQLTGQTSAR